MLHVADTTGQTLAVSLLLLVGDFALAEIRSAVQRASGGVGSLAVQMAKARGEAHIVGVCSTRNDAFVRSLGADETIDYTRTCLTEAVEHRSLDAVIDCVGGRHQWIAAKTVLRAGGRFATKDPRGRLLCVRPRRRRRRAGDQQGGTDGG